MIRIILDSFRICNENADIVANVKAEKAAFDFIDNCLKQNISLDQEKTFLVKGVSCQRFNAYKNVVKGIQFEEITPRGQIKKLVHHELPDWLTDKTICRWGLLERDSPKYVSESDLPATICSWFIPGISKVSTLSGWLDQVAQSTSFPNGAHSDIVYDWLVDKFKSVAASAISSPEALTYLAGKLANASSPACFANEWIKRSAMLPLLKMSSPLRIPNLSFGSPADLAYAKHIPLLFPNPMGRAISEQMKQAITGARINGKSFTEVVLSLNAVWDGVAEELDQWLKINPRAMTCEACKHLKGLVGFSTNNTAKMLVENYSPPEEVPSWSGVDDNFDNWVNKYIRFVRTSFLRRDLAEDYLDPAATFAKWFKQNFTVSYHPEKGYRVIAEIVQTKLKEGRLVILLMIDALAIHICHDAVKYISDKLETQPTAHKYLFAPIPTITEVCKNAVLTGFAPVDCQNDLRSDLMRAYGLSNDEIVLASNWNDAERLQLKNNTKLLIYKDNRIDDRLKMAGNYRNLLEENVNVFSSFSLLLKRWVDDYFHRNQCFPFIVLTSDHGFTYGPPPGSKTSFNVELDGTHRCVQVSDGFLSNHVSEDDYTYIDKNVFKLRNNFVVAKGRKFGLCSDTLSGWALSHGGLLPEEVIIPETEWYGDGATIAWPLISFSENVVYDRGSWLVKISLSNVHTMPILGGDLTIRATSGRESRKARFTTIYPGQAITIEEKVPEDNVEEKVETSFDFTIQLLDKSGKTLAEKHEQLLVNRTLILSERTSQQDDFESMF
jgi:hypothetical protein